MSHISLKVAVNPHLDKWSHPTLKQVESCYIAHILGLNKGNVTRAAKALGMTRRTLQRKLSRGLDAHSSLDTDMIEISLDET